MNSEDKPYWWPVLNDVDELVASGWKYRNMWAHISEARESYALLADAFLALVAEHERCATRTKET